METDIFQQLNEAFVKINFIKQSIASGMTIEQAIEEYKNQNQQ